MTHELIPLKSCGFKKRLRRKPAQSYPTIYKKKDNVHILNYLSPFSLVNSKNYEKQVIRKVSVVEEH